MNSPPEATRSLTIAICTYRRPRELTALLTEVRRSTDREASGLAIRVVVADDCPDGSAAAVVQAARHGLGLLVEYLNPASGNVSRARNAAITAASNTDLVLCIDDDCTPAEGWITELLRIADSTGADIVTGHHEFIAPDDAPAWLTTEPFLQDHGIFADGTDPAVGNMANVLLRGDWLRQSNVAFRADLGTTGGEDMVFFADARSAGATVRHAAYSLVREPYQGFRTTTRYQLYRQAWLGNNEAAINRVTRECSSIRLVLRGARRVATGVVRPFARAVRFEAPQVRWSLALVGSGLGLIAGVLRVRLRHR